MSDGRSGGSRWRDLAKSITADLRAVAATLSERRVGDADLEAAAALARELRQRLDGPRRPRWYDRDAMDLAPGDRVAYLDQSPIVGHLNAIAPPLRVELVEGPDGEKRAEARTNLSRAYEGPPHGVHGGWVAALFDEVLGTVQGAGADHGVTATLKVKYRAVTPIESDLLFRGWIHERRGRRILVRGTCHAGATLTAEAEGMFIRVDFNEIEDRMRGDRRDG
jgi:acyl-coenzyme A thioesterase PaaI-like protein